MPNDTELLHTVELVAVNNSGVDWDSSWAVNGRTRTARIDKHKWLESFGIDGFFVLDCVFVFLTHPSPNVHTGIAAKSFPNRASIVLQNGEEKSAKIKPVIEA